MTCPLLGLAGDRSTHFEFPVRTHRCWAAARPMEVEMSFQTVICIGPDFRDCVRHRIWAQKQAAAMGPGPGIEPKAASQPYPEKRPFLRKRLTANTEHV